MMREVDWTGVAVAPLTVAPLTAETFVERLRLLSIRARDIQLLRQAMAQSRENEKT